MFSARDRNNLAKRSSGVKIVRLAVLMHLILLRTTYLPLLRPVYLRVF